MKYGAIVTSDNALIGSQDRTVTNQYTVTFTVTGGTGWLYDLTIQTDRRGQLDLFDDSLGTARPTFRASPGPSTP